MIPPRMMTGTLTIGGAAVPAYVGAISVETEWSGSQRVWTTVDVVTAIVPADTAVTEGNTATWRGDNYRVSGVLTRRRPTDPADHHTTLRLERSANI